MKRCLFFLVLHFLSFHKGPVLLLIPFAVPNISPYVRSLSSCLRNPAALRNVTEEQLTPPTRLALLLHMLLFRRCRCSRERTLVANVPYKWEGVAAFNRMEWTAYLWGEQQGLSSYCYQSIPTSHLHWIDPGSSWSRLQWFRFFYSLSGKREDKKTKPPEGRVSGNDFQPWVNHLVDP